MESNTEAAGRPDLSKGLGVQVSELQQGSRTATLPCGVTLSYRPHLCTQPVLQGMQRLLARKDSEGNENPDVLGFSRVLCKLVTAWDIGGPVGWLTITEAGEVEETELVPEGQPVPLDPEVVQHLNVLVLSAVALELAVDSVPPTMTAKLLASQ